MTDNEALVLANDDYNVDCYWDVKLVCKKPIYEALAENLLAMMGEVLHR